MKQARRRALRIAHELEAGSWKATPAPCSVKEGIGAYTNFLRAEGRALKTLSKYEKVFERVLDLAEQMKIKDLAGLNLQFIDRYKQRRSDSGTAPKTRYSETVIIRQLINFAISRDMLVSDPLKGIRLPKPKPTPQPCWTYEQVQAILANSPDMVKPALTLLVETGIRFSEMAWLVWEDVDVKANVLHIRPKDGWRPKTGDQRTVPLSPIGRALLENLPRQGRWVVTMPPSRRHAHVGRQWTERRLLAELKKILRKLKLPGKVHTARHHFISNSLMKGVPEATLRKWVGHVDEEILKVYTHIHDRASQAAMQRLHDANINELQLKKEPGDEGKEVGHGSAQNQHTEEEGRHGGSAS
jgi:site-specific recombinase XerD